MIICLLQCGCTNFVYNLYNINFKTQSKQTEMIWNPMHMQQILRLRGFAKKKATFILIN